MKKKLTVKEYVYVASMLFGLFFGAGNLSSPLQWVSLPAAICGAPSWDC